MRIVKVCLSLLLGTVLFCHEVVAATGALGKELYDAVLFQDILQLQALIAKGADVNHKENGRPILGWAAQSGNVEVVDILLKAGANPNVPDDSSGHTPLIRAIETQQLSVIKSLLKAKANPNAVSKDGKTCLMHAIESHQPKVVQALIIMGADVNYVSPDGNSAALVAALDGLPESLEAIRLLGKAKANLNASNIIYTPLIYAIQQGSTELVKALLESGADPNAKSSSGEVPLITALDNPEILQQLLDKKADPNLANSSGTPLTQAVHSGNLEAVRMLLKAGANTELKDSYGSTAREIAERNYQTEILELLKPQSSGAVVGSAGTSAGQPRSGECSMADAAKLQMEIHGLLQAQVDAGKMDSSIFRTFLDDTKEYGDLLVKDPNEACKLLERLRQKYGV